MVSFMLVLFGFAQRLRRAQRDPEFRSIAVMVAALLTAGTVFYTKIEGWSPLDALYFSVITLATVGYGDLVPRTAEGKIFTMVYLMLGIGLIVAFADRLMRGMPRPGDHSLDTRRVKLRRNRRGRRASSEGCRPATGHL
jgi:voltage-gated potassium channel Kch